MCYLDEIINMMMPTTEGPSYIDSGVLPSIEKISNDVSIHTNITKGLTIQDLFTTSDNNILDMICCSSRYRYSI